jgi:hypothetical protein
MRARPVLVHLDRIKDLVATLPTEKAFAFDAIAAERQWLVYVRAAKGKDWGNPPLFRSTMDAIWRWLLGLASVPASLAADCETLLFNDVLEDSDSAAFQIVNNLNDLLTRIQENRTWLCFMSAQTNIDIIDSFVYQSTGMPINFQSDLVVDNHPLMQSEMKRQSDDLETLKQQWTPALVEKLRDKYQGQSVLGDFWYEK